MSKITTIKIEKILKNKLDEFKGETYNDKIENLILNTKNRQKEFGQYTNILKEEIRKIVRQEIQRVSGY